MSSYETQSQVDTETYNKNVSERRKRRQDQPEEKKHKKVKKDYPRGCDQSDLDADPRDVMRKCGRPACEIQGTWLSDFIPSHMPSEDRICMGCHNQRRRQFVGDSKENPVVIDSTSDDEDKVCVVDTSDDEDKDIPLPFKSDD